MATNKTVFFLIGILLIVLGASMLAPYVLQVVLDEGSHSFISASFVTIFIGILFVLANLEKEFKLNLDFWKKNITPMIRNNDYKNFDKYFKKNKKITLLRDYDNIIKKNRDLNSREIKIFDSELKNKLISQIPERLYPILYMDDLNSMMNSN